MGCTNNKEASKTDQKTVNITIDTPSQSAPKTVWEMNYEIIQNAPPVASAPGYPGPKTNKQDYLSTLSQLHLEENVELKEIRNELMKLVKQAAPAGEDKYIYIMPEMKSLFNKLRGEIKKEIYKDIVANSKKAN